MVTPVQINTATAFCKHVEAKLGWVPSDAGLPTYRRYQAEAAKVLRKQQEDPQLYTWPNLTKAVDWLAKEKRQRSPVGVFAYVRTALEASAKPETPLEEEIRAAMRLEAAKGDPDNWVERMSRAIGPHRAELLAEWWAEQ